MFLQFIFCATFRGSESSTGGSSFGVSAHDVTGAGLGAAEKSLDSRSKAVLSSMVFYRAEEDRKLNAICMSYLFITSS